MTSAHAADGVGRADQRTHRSVDLRARDLRDRDLHEVPVSRAGADQGFAEVSPEEHVMERLQAVAEDFWRGDGIGGGHQCAADIGASLSLIGSHFQRPQRSHDDPVRLP